MKHLTNQQTKKYSPIVHSNLNIFVYSNLNIFKDHTETEKFYCSTKIKFYSPTQCGLQDLNDGVKPKPRAKIQN